MLDLRKGMHRLGLVWQKKILAELHLTHISEVGARCQDLVFTFSNPALKSALVRKTGRTDQ